MCQALKVTVTKANKIPHLEGFLPPQGRQNLTKTLSAYGMLKLGLFDGTTDPRSLGERGLGLWGGQWNVCGGTW